MVRSRRTLGWPALGIPHPRGDGPSSWTAVSPYPPYSPPAWGWSATKHPKTPNVVVFPTRVGMVRLPNAHLLTPCGIPHPRGDGPENPEVDWVRSEERR